MIRTLAVAAALAGAIFLAPVAQAQPENSTGPDPSNSVGSPPALSRVSTVARATGKAANKFAPSVTATPFGSARTIGSQPGLAIANGTTLTRTGTPFGYPTPMSRGNLVGPAATTEPPGGGIRTRHGMALDTSPLGGLLGGLFG